MDTRTLPILPAVAAVLAVLSAGTLSQAQTVPGIALDPPAESNPAPAQPGQLKDTISAPHLTVGEKFEYRVVQSLGLRNFAGSAISAAIGQAENSPHEWGQGTSGFTKRYASAFAGQFSRQAFEFTLENAFHQDPRYFPLSKGRPFKERTLNALKQAVWAKNDNGSSGIAYARLIGTFGAAELANTWQPPSTGSQASAVKRTFIGIGSDAGYNFLQEFFPFIRPLSLRHRH